MIHAKLLECRQYTIDTLGREKWADAVQSLSSSFYEGVKVSGLSFIEYAILVNDSEEASKKLTQPDAARMINLAVAVELTLKQSSN